MVISIKKTTLLMIGFSFLINQPFAKAANVPAGEIKALREVGLDQNGDNIDYTQHVFHKTPTKANLQLVAANSNIPEFAYRDMQVLADYGIISLPAGVTSVKSSDFTRKDMALLTIKALDAFGLKDTPAKPLVNSNQGVKEALELKKEFDYELRNYGKDASAVANSTKPSKQADDDVKDDAGKYKFTGELRYDYWRNSGAEKFDGLKDSYLRLRLYLEAKINDAWHAFTMLEANKHFLYYGEDSWFVRPRFYVKGLTGATIITAGRFGWLAGEGNIYDTAVTAARAQVGYPTVYDFLAGETSEGSKVISAVATYQDGENKFGGGLYKFGEDDWGNEDVLIYNAFARFTHHKTSLGVMLLGSNKSDELNHRYGYVLSALYGDLKSWRPGTHELEFKLYRQPTGTYAVHTMNGLANYMDGFKGYSILYHLAISKEIVWGIEYYSLKDLVTGDNGRTFWTDINLNF